MLGDRAVGICDSPVRPLPPRRRARSAATPERAVVRLLRPQPPRLAARRARRRRRPPARRLLDDDDALAGFEEGRLFGGEWLRSLGMIPNEYLYYFYYAADTVDAIRGGAAARRVPARAAARVLRAATGRTRPRRSPPGAPRATSASAPTWPRRATPRAIEAEHDDGDANGGYEGEAMAVVEAIALNTRAVLILNTANRSACRSWTSARSSRCRASSAAPARCRSRSGDVPAHARALVETIKDVERTTIEAALPGSRELAVKALALHPLVPSSTPRAQIFDGYRERLPALQEALRDERRRRLRRARLPRPDVRRARRDPAARARSASPATSCARPAAARSPRSAPPGSGSRARSSSPLGDDLAGRHPAAPLLDRRRRALGRPARRTRTPVTVDHAVRRRPRDGRPSTRAKQRRAAELAAVEPRAVVALDPALDLAPAGARVYATVGDVDARALAGGELRRRPRPRPRAARQRARGAAADRAERPPRRPRARSARDVAARRSSRSAPDGALAARRRTGSCASPGVAVEAVDTTGAGDLFAAAYVWADHWGAARASACAGRSCTRPSRCTVATAVAGAVTLRALLEEGAEHGLASPVRSRRQR